MEKKLHHFNVRQAKIHRSLYQSSNPVLFIIRLVATVFISGQSPTEYRPGYNRRK
jgi:hypothetical protein